jgi:hypothetical protein
MTTPSGAANDADALVGVARSGGGDGWGTELSGTAAAAGREYALAEAKENDELELSRGRLLGRSLAGSLPAKVPSRHPLEYLAPLACMRSFLPRWRKRKKARPDNTWTGDGSAR